MVFVPFHCSLFFFSFMSSLSIKAGRNLFLFAVNYHSPIAHGYNYSKMLFLLSKKKKFYSIFFSFVLVLKESSLSLSSTGGVPHHRSATACGGRRRGGSRRRSAADLEKERSEEAACRHGQCKESRGQGQVIIAQGLLHRSMNTGLIDVDKDK